MTPKIRQILYTVSAVASAIIPLLVTYQVLDPSSGTAWINLVGFLGALGGTGAATAAVVTSRQRKDGTLDFTGSPAQQAIDAIHATVNQATNAATDLGRVRDAVTGVLASLPVVGEVLDAVTGRDDDPASANYQP
jgi:hypothetical protein